MEEQDFEEAWRRVAVRHAVRWDWPLEDVYDWLLVQAVAMLAKAAYGLTDYPTKVNKTVDQGPRMAQKQPQLP